MPLTVNQGFQEFLGRLTPSSSESDAAKRHRASIKQCIESNFGLDRFWRIGSFGNGTSISGYSDVDYMAGIPTTNLKADSSAPLSELRSVLATRLHRTGVRTSCPAVIVPFGSDAKETTEVTPGDYIRTANGHKVYDIPDCDAGWMAASPDAHNDFVRSTDNKLASKVRPLIRFIKAWKYFRDVPISSFYLELRVAQYASSESSIVYSIDVKRVFTLLDNIGLASIRDPVGISGLISPCRSDAQLSQAKSKVSTALGRATKARAMEDGGRIADAYSWWNKLYNNRFPKYG